MKVGKKTCLLTNQASTWHAKKQKKIKTMLGCQNLAPHIHTHPQQNEKKKRKWNNQNAREKEKNSQPCGGEEQNGTQPLSQERKNKKFTQQLGQKQMGTWSISDVGLLFSRDEAGSFLWLGQLSWALAKVEQPRGFPTCPGWSSPISCLILDQNQVEQFKEKKTKSHWRISVSKARESGKKTFSPKLTKSQSSWAKK